MRRGAAGAAAGGHDAARAGTLGILAGLLVALIAYEAIRYADARERVRHELAREPVAE